MCTNPLWTTGATTGLSELAETFSVHSPLKSGFVMIGSRRARVSLLPASPFVTNVRELNAHAIRVLDVNLIVALQSDLCLGHGFLQRVQRRLRVVLLDAETEVIETWLLTRIGLVDAQEAVLQPEFAEVLVLSPDRQACKTLVERFRT